MYNDNCCGDYKGLEKLDLSKNLTPNKEIVDKQTEYASKYASIEVTYYDNSKKSFTPFQWALFEKGVRKISKNIDFIDIKS